MRCLIVLSLVAAVPAQAQTPASLSVQLPGGSAQGTVAVTIYNNDVALVQDVRQTALAGGRSTVEFPDVSAQIRPETVTLSGADFGIVEQNFDYDLLSPAALMQKAVGQIITIVRVNPATGAETREQARVLAANGGVVLQIGTRIEVLRDDGLPVRVIFDRVPPNLRARPTLSVTLDSRNAGTRPLTLSYLTPGLSWKADYVARFNEAAGKIDVQGWITLSNNSGTTYTNAQTLLVAGQAGANGLEPQEYIRRPMPRNTGIVTPGTETANRERLGDFYLYPIKERTTIAQAQQKQVSFLDVTGAPASKGYEFRNGWLGSADEARSAATVLRFSTSRANNPRGGGLGDALPAGTVRVYVRDARGQAQFIGENMIGHTPMGSSLDLRTGDAFDVKVKPVVERRERVGSATAGRWTTTMRYTLTNARPAAVVVDLVQAGLDGGTDTRIISESLQSERRSAGEALWQVTVPANGEAVVTATFDTRF